MKSTLLTLSTLLATALFTGCGSNASTTDTATAQPHDTRALGRVISIQKDWSWFVDSTIKNHGAFDGFDLRVDFYQGLPTSVKHYQYFMDTDNDKSTGFTGENGWEIFGADYLIEDGTIFKYKPDADDAWKWEAVRSFDNELLVHKGGMASLTLDGLFQLQEEILGDAREINTMIEVYDKDWGGDYPTVTDIVTTVTGGETTPPDLQSYEYRRITDANGNIIEEQKRKDDGTYTRLRTYTYNAQGQKIEQHAYASSTHTVYTYNDRGELASRTFRHRGIKGVETFTYLYDDLGRKTTMTKLYKEYRKNYADNSYDLKKEKTEVYMHTYIGDTDQIKTITLDGTFYQSFTYDADGRVATRTTRETYADPAEGVGQLTETYTYDQEGRVIRIERKSDNPDKPDRVYNYSYETAAAN